MIDVIRESPHANELPEDWVEAYYHAETDGKHTVLTAVYEHPGLNIILPIIPRTTLDQAKEWRTDHEIGYIYPVYDDIGIPGHHSHTFRQLKPFINSLIPEVRPLPVDETPNVHAGPYQYRDANTPVHSLGGARYSMESFDWTQLPAEAIDALQSYKQYPLDYQPFVNDLYNNPLHHAEELDKTEPGLIPDPFPLRYTVHETDDGEKSLYPIPLPSNTFIDALDTHVDRESIDLEPYEEGDVLAEVWIEFDHTTLEQPTIVRISELG